MNQSSTGEARPAFFVAPELANSLSLLNATLDSTADAILALDLSGKIACYNSKFVSMWKIPPEMVERGDSVEMAKFVASRLSDPTRFLQRYARLHDSPEDDVFDVLELKDGQTFERYAHTLRVAGKRAGVVISYRDITDRKRAETELAYERDLLRTLLENSPDQIYFKDLKSRFIKSSHAQARNFGVKSPDELIGKTDFDFFSDAHARPAFEDEQKIIRTGEPVIGKIERESFPDGRQGWVLASKMPLRNDDGEIIGTFGISKDITAIKEAEEKFETVHRQLLDASRQAGMAEVATGVLHNVGNVLNSVNVSTALLADQVQRSKAGTVGKVAALLQEHAGNLAEFLTKDSRGRQLPEFLHTLTAHLAREQAAMLTEVESLRRNIDHIKEIVAMQQSYATVAGIMETVPVIDLVEDALRMNSGALTRHEVTLVRDYQAQPFVHVEKHKVLQILVNLMRNAKYACDEAGGSDKLMTVRVTLEAERVKIAVIDNGVGIPPENLVRIFVHGFTTRKQGHGFGLHSCALAARELGGSLTVRSDGLGKGAVFVLDLPRVVNS